MAKKERITITIDAELLDWIDRKVEEKVFANRSHGIAFLVKQKAKQEKEEHGRT